MNTLIPGAPLRSLSPTSIEYQRAQGASRAAKPARAARFTLDAPEHSGTIPGAIGDILPPGVALTSNLAVIFTLNQYSYRHRILSMVAAHEGARSVLAIDVDPEAVECARANLARNGLSAESASSALAGKS